MSLARDIADLASVTSRLDTLGGSSGSFGVGRNMLINGDMSVAQREATSYAVGDADAYKNVDRWKVFAANTAGRATLQQSTDAPSGFTNSLKFSCTTADTSIASNESFGIAQHIEAGTCARTGTGTSDAKQITFSFYAKADSTKTYVVQLLNNKHSSYIHNNRTFTVTSSWQRFTMTFQADTTADSEFDGTLTDAGFSLSFYLHAGSDFTSATLASDWATGTTNRAAGTQSFFSATSNTFFVTGCQLESGGTATDFEHRSFADQLQACQRYYQKVGRDFSDSTPTTAFGWGYTTSSSAAEGMFRFEKRMRTAPTFTQSTDQNLDFQTNTGSGAVHASNAFTSVVLSEMSAEFTQQNHSSNFGGAGQPYFLKWNGVQSAGLSASIQLDAEL